MKASELMISRYGVKGEDAQRYTRDHRLITNAVALSAASMWGIVVAGYILVADYLSFGTDILIVLVAGSTIMGAISWVLAYKL